MEVYYYDGDDDDDDTDDGPEGGGQRLGGWFRARVEKIAPTNIKVRYTKDGSTEPIYDADRIRPYPNSHT